MPTTLHIISHTHWDREWFLTAEYTSRWIPRLVDRISQLAAENPDFRYLLDGQTLVVEDLLAVAPEYQERVRKLVVGGQLQIGPYYCQPDWQLSTGELLIRNLLYGQRDRLEHSVQRRPGLEGSVGWLVDTFGHISQAPQIHRLFGIDAAYIWRGVPRLEPYFNWQGPDGSDLFTVNLFGGYRNLYGVTHVPQVALRRLQTEAAKLQPYYPTPDLPLFDGYDLEDNPEDPVRFYTEHFDDELRALSQHLLLQENTAEGFARTIMRHNLSLPTLRGELNSGKYGATFPGTLSARSYLKVMARDCERLLLSRAEPLAALAHLNGRPYQETRYEGWSRRLLQNAVHDCICGVSIDLVHEKMEYSYRRLFEEITEDLHASLAATLHGFQEGDYAVSTNPFASEQWQTVGETLFHTRTEGIGVWPITARHALKVTSRTVPSFTWRNEHYQAEVQSFDGAVRLAAAGTGALGRFVVFRERGDTYSTEPGEQLGWLQATSPLIVIQQTEHHAEVHFHATWQGVDEQVSCDVRLTFDPSPLIRWQIELDTVGTNLRVDMRFESGPVAGVFAAMPYDIVSRPFADSDLLPRDLPSNLDNVLLGQRELDAVLDFALNDFFACALQSGETVAIFTQGIRSYRAAENGSLSLTLRRAVQWLAAPHLHHRVGDAGPFFYVPGARCERRVRHHVALAAGSFTPQSMTVLRLNEIFQNPPLIVRVQGNGDRRRWSFLSEDLPLSSLTMRQGAMLARFYNPLPHSRSLARAYRQTDLWGNDNGIVTMAAPHQILTTVLPLDGPPAVRQDQADVTLLTPPLWRVGPDRSAPDPALLQALEQKVAQLSDQVAAVGREQEQATGAARLRLEHRAFVLERERLEHRLSLVLNHRRAQWHGEPDANYLYTYDHQIAAIGESLNRLRIKRRIFDYVVQAL